MVRASKDRIVAGLLADHGTTLADEAGIALRDAPSPLYRLFVTAALSGAPVRPAAAIGAARALFAEGWSSAERMAAVRDGQRARMLREAGYPRFVGRAAVTLGSAARLLVESAGGDLRRIRRTAEGDPERLRALLTGFPGVGKTAAAIFLAEVQSLWSEIAPVATPRALTAARELGLGGSAAALAALVEPEELPRLVAALSRAGTGSAAGAAARPRQ